MIKLKLHYRMIARRRKPNVWLPMYVFMCAIFVIIMFYMNVIPCCNITWIECCNNIFSRSLGIGYIVLLYHIQKILKKKKNTVHLFFVLCLLFLTNYTANHCILILFKCILFIWAIISIFDIYCICTIWYGINLL